MLAPAAMPSPAVQLHRARFLDHTPSSITAISFAPLPLPPPEVIGKGKGKEVQVEHDSAGEEFGVLVVARENGVVEIWEWTRDGEGGVGNWVLETVSFPSNDISQNLLMEFWCRSFRRL